jgi:hypothetical protein
MKTIITSFALILITLTGAQAQSGYEKAMGKAMAEMEAAKTPDEMLAVANTFERISQKASDRYLPHYYAALNLLNYNWTINDPVKRDEIIDRALEEVKKAQKLVPGNDEVEVLNGYGLMAKMTVDPANRGQSYSPAIMQSFGKALSMNPENPRAMIMMAQMELGTAQYMGTETTKACEMAKKGMALIAEKEQRDDFEPSWGKESAERILQSCND